MPNIRVRPYQPSDRPKVRSIAYATGYMGDPPTWYWRHRESFADIWTSHYTDVEPDSLFVAEDGDRVVGYLAGCVDSSSAPSPASAVVRQMFRHWLLVRPGTAGFFWRSFADTVGSTRVPSGEISDPRWPAHLHINLLAEARGRGAGAGLVRAWFERLRDTGSPGCHLGTLAENRNAIAFFERMGFRAHGEPHLLPGMRSPAGGRNHLQLMVVDFAMLLRPVGAPPQRS